MKTFVSVPFLLIYLLLAVLLCWRRDYVRLGQGLLLAAVFGLYLFSTPLMTRLLARLVAVPAPLANAHTLAGEGYQAIVVLGGGLYRGPELGGVEQAGLYSLARLRYGARLARTSGLPVLVTGIEAPAMARTLGQDFGITPRWQEPDSVNTDENARFSARLLGEQGVRRVVLVTDAWHMERARQAFSHYGLAVKLAPTDFPLAFFSEPPALLAPSALLFELNMFGLAEGLGQLKYRWLYRHP